MNVWNKISSAVLVQTLQQWMICCQPLDFFLVMFPPKQQLIDIIVSLTDAEITILELTKTKRVTSFFVILWYRLSDSNVFWVYLQHESAAILYKHFRFCCKASKYKCIIPRRDVWPEITEACRTNLWLVDSGAINKNKLPTSRNYWNDSTIWGPAKPNVSLSWPIFLQELISSWSRQSTQISWNWSWIKTTAVKCRNCLVSSC